MWIRLKLIFLNMKWSFSKKTLIIVLVIIVLVPVLFFSGLISIDVGGRIDGNILSQSERVELDRYIRALNLPQEKSIIVVLNGSICPNNIRNLERMNSEINSEFIFFIFDTKYIRFDPMLKSVHDRIVLTNHCFIDKRNSFSNIYPFMSYPLVLYRSGSKIIGGKLLKNDNYEEIMNDFKGLIN